MSEKETIQIGLIGLGEMGKLYAERLSGAGWKKINVCDQPSKFEQVKAFCEGTTLTPMENGHLVSRQSDFIVYSVEASLLNNVVAMYGPSTKIGAIVAGQTSVKAPEKEAFEKHLPADTSIISIHSLHGPTVKPDGQALIIIKYRGTDKQTQLVERILTPLNSRFVPMTYEEHDLITANTQAVTHAAFLSMGTAWKCSGQFPWETGRYIGGIEVIKTNIALRIYAAKWHVYAGLAIMNPSAKILIAQYAQSVTILFKLMVEEKETELRNRVFAARDFVFGKPSDPGSRNTPVLLEESVLDQFAIGSPSNIDKAAPNSHLSLLAMVDCWHQMKIKPFVHLALAATPVFKLWIGVAEYLFRSEERLEGAIQAACWDKSHRSDDTEFAIAARGWSQCVEHGSFEWYKSRFDETRAFFEPRFKESAEKNAKLMAAFA